MTIARLEIKGFRCLGDIGIELHPKLTFIAGANASGKSSLIDAIEHCLTGRCRGTDEAGKGSKFLIRDGESSLMTRAVFSDGTYQARTVSADGKTLADPPDSTLNRNVLRCLMKGENFLSLDHKTAKALLLDVLDVKIEYGGDTLTLAQLDSKYQMAFEQRRQAKANLSAIQIPALPTGEVPDVPKLEAKLTELRAEEHVLTAKEAHGGGKREAVQAQIDRASAAMVKAAAAWQAHPKPAEIDAQIAALDAMTLPTAGDVTARATAEKAEVDGQLSKLADGVRWLKTYTPSAGCVMSREIPCSTPSTAFMSHLAVLQREVSSLENRQKELAATIKTEAEETERRRVTETKRHALEASRRDAEQLADAAVKAESEVDRLKKELDALPADTGPSPELVTLRARITKGEEVVRSAREVVRQRIEHEDRITQQAAAAEALQKLETTVAELGPKGVRVKALAETIGAFTASINNALGPFGYELSFTLEPWDVVVNGRSAELLSTSERLRVGVAFALALAEVTGIGLVCVDGADLLDGSGRAVLSELVASWDAGQVIVAATRPEPLPSGDGYLAYWLSREPEGPTTITQS